MVLRYSSNAMNKVTAAQAHHPRRPRPLSIPTASALAVIASSRIAFHAVGTLNSPVRSKALNGTSVPRWARSAKAMSRPTRNAVAAAEPRTQGRTGNVVS